MKNSNSGKSLLDLAEEILLEKKEHTNMYELFDIACKKRGIKESHKKELIAQFYTDMISSAKFVYLGDNEWDLKGNQEITLWEKDGSYYKEYNKVDVPGEISDDPKVVKAAKAKAAKAARAAKAKIAKAAKLKAAAEEAALLEEASAVVEEPVVTVEVVENEVAVGKDIPVIVEIIPEQTLEFEEELFEEVDDDFDEEKYNEYMDTYEDQYED